MIVVGRFLPIPGLLRTVGATLVVIIAVMMTFREIGLVVTRLMVEVGTMGLPIGFGAQSRVQDVIGGFFILLADQFHVRDAVQTAGMNGPVKGVTLRMTIG